METLPLQGTPRIPRFTKDKVSEEKKTLSGLELGSFGAALEHSFVLTTLGRGPPPISASCQGSSKTTVVSVGLWLLLLALCVAEKQRGVWEGWSRERWGVLQGECAGRHGEFA